MRSRNAARALLGIALLWTTSCWPGVPIVALLAASGGGGGGGGSGAGGGQIHRLSGKVALTPPPETVVGLSERLESEPNDRLGGARALSIGRGMRSSVRGSAEFRGLQLLLTQDEQGRSLWVERNWVAGSERRQRPRSLSRWSNFEPEAIAASHDSVLLAQVIDGRLRVREQGSIAGLPRTEWDVPFPGELRGWTILDGIAIALQRDPHVHPSQAFIGLDPRTGEVLFQKRWDGPALRQLASGLDPIESARTHTRTSALFSWNETSGEVLRFEVLQQDDDRRISDPRPIALVQDLRALAYDGASLQVWTGDRELWLESHSGALQFEAPVRDGESIRGAAALLDLGTDGFHLRLDPGEAVSVQLWAARSAPSAEPAEFQFTVWDRRRALVGEEAALSTTECFGGGHTAPQRLTGDANGLDVDLIITCSRGAGEYRLVVSDPQAPAVSFSLQPSTFVESAEAARRHRALLEMVPVETLSHTALLDYADPTLAEHLAGSIVYATHGNAAPPIDRAGSLLLRERQRSSAAGYRVLDAVRDPSLPFASSPRFEGAVVPAERQRLEDGDLCLALCELAGDPSVLWCEPVFRLHALAEPNDEFFPDQRWAYDAMNCPAAWDTTTGSNSVRIGVVDTGIRTENSDIAPNLGSGYDFVSDVGDAGDGDGIDDDPYDEGDYISHGTHVGGSAGARGNNGRGVTGVMWRATIVPVRALGVSGGGSTLDIAQAIRFAAGLANDSGTTISAVDVINLSLGSASGSSAMHDAVIAATNAGVLCIAATGNDGTPGVLFPAAFDECVAVGATDIFDGLASYSNTGPEVEVVAPGGDSGDFDADGNPDMILSTIGSPTGTGPDRFAFLAGTSMATGLSSGVAGLVLSVFPTATASELRTLLRTHVRDLGANGRDNRFGFGLLDAQATIEGATPELMLPAHDLDFGFNGDSLLLQAENIGAGTLQVTGLTKEALIGDDADWLTATVLADDRTIGLVADRNRLVEGAYLVRVTVVSNGGTDEIMVSLTQSSDPLPDVGEVTLQVLDSDGKVLRSTTTRLAMNYAFEFADLGNGPFFLRCGVDADKDQVLCEGSELCGQYPTFDAPATIRFDDLEDPVMDIVLVDPTH